MKRIGVLGGTFDPVHFGHIGLGENASMEFNLDEVLLVPAFVQPFKKEMKVTDASHRIEMLKLASGESKFNLKVSTLEIDRGEVSYSFDTITSLRKEYSKDELWFIMGSDSMMHLHTWHKGLELIDLCNFIVGLRPNNQIELVKTRAKELKEKYNARIHLMKKLMLPISSTDIRERVAKGESIKELVPSSVEKYIYEQRLYTD